MEKQTAWFRFFGTLNDFINKHQKDQWIEYSFTGTPAVKDAIEAIGIPHVEIKKILTGGMPVVFLHRMHPQHKFEVYPFERESADEAEKKFVLDVHLGSLARMMRLLGFDTCYQKNYTDKVIASMATTDSRIVLTRDVGLLKHKTIERGYWLRSQITNDQLAEVIHRFNLSQHFKPFSRCMACNGRIEPVDKNLVLHRLLPLTSKSFDEFFQCISCQRIYWKGSHYESMCRFINKLQKNLHSKFQC